MTPTEIRELTEALRREIAALPPENEDSRSENATLRAENSELRAEVAALRRRLDPDSSTNSKPFYDRGAFAGSSSALPPAPAISISSADAPVMWYNELPRRPRSTSRRPRACRARRPRRAVSKYWRRPQVGADYA